VFIKSLVLRCYSILAVAVAVAVVVVAVVVVALLPNANVDSRYHPFCPVPSCLFFYSFFVSFRFVSFFLFLIIPTYQYQLEHDDPPNADADIDADVAVIMATSRRHRGLRSSAHLAVATKVGGGGIGPGLRTTDSLSRGPSKCKTQKCRQKELYKMQTRYHMKPHYTSGKCGRFCKDDDSTADMIMETDNEAVINTLLLSDESFSLNSPEHKKWEYLACKKVKDEIDDYSYGSIEDCSIIFTGCEDVDDNEDLEDLEDADVGGVTYVVADNRDVEDSDIVYSFTMLD
jgi:hypothetical protein